MRTLSIGKIRGLQQCSTPRGAISVLALDHRNNLRTAINSDSPDSVSDEMLTSFKREVISILAPVSSAVLTDPQFGAAQCIASTSLPGNCGLLVAAEETGYTGNPNARESKVLPGWSIEKTRRMGASAVKLLVYYHPDSSTAMDIENLVRQVANECAKYDLLLFLEPLSYSLDPAAKKLDPESRRRVVIETAKRLTPLGVDILKAEFPLDITANESEMDWADACQELSAASVVPWVLLSASVSFETYLRQVNVACRQGASGVAVGRAVWQEAVLLSGEERRAFLEQVARQRMARITELCDALAKPWNSFYSAGDPGSDWYINY